MERKDYAWQLHLQRFRDDLVSVYDTLNQTYLAEKKKKEDPSKIEQLASQVREFKQGLYSKFVFNAAGSIPESFNNYLDDSLAIADIDIKKDGQYLRRYFGEALFTRK